MKKIEESYLTEKELKELFQNQFSIVTDKSWFNNDKDMKEVYELGIEGVLKESSKCIFGVLEKLNELPRNDVFWVDYSDRRGITGKIYAYIYLLLKEDPNDILALWAIVGLKLVYAANDFGIEYWKHLYKLGGCNIKHIILVALLANFTINFTFDLMIGFIKETHSKTESLEVLYTLSNANSFDISCWADFIIKRL